MPKALPTTEIVVHMDGAVGDGSLESRNRNRKWSRITSSNQTSRGSARTCSGMMQSINWFNILLDLYIIYWGFNYGRNNEE
jgi:hypothetical protein